MADNRRVAAGLASAQDTIRKKRWADRSSRERIKGVDYGNFILSPVVAVFIRRNIKKRHLADIHGDEVWEAQEGKNSLSDSPKKKAIIQTAKKRRERRVNPIGDREVKKKGMFGGKKPRKKGGRSPPERSKNAGQDNFRTNAELRYLSVDDTDPRRRGSNGKGGGGSDSGKIDGGGLTSSRKRSRTQEARERVRQGGQKHQKKGGMNS